jgi:hypothetical protein
MSKPRETETAVTSIPFRFNFVVVFGVVSAITIKVFVL